MAMQSLFRSLFANSIVKGAFNVVFKAVHRVWPKNDRIIAFIESDNSGFTDNPRFLFCRLLEKHSDRYDVIWLSLNDHLVNEMNARETTSGRFMRLYSLQGIFTLLKARVIIISNVIDDMFSKKAVTIQLWHGIPIKAIGGSMRNLSEREAKRVRKSFWKGTSYWISSSEADRKVTAQCTGLPEERVPVLGYPRNDVLVEQKLEPSSALLRSHPYLRKKIILYAPTWRDDEMVRFFPFDDLEMSELFDLLERHDAYMLMRGHYMDDVVRGTELGVPGSDRLVPANRDSFEDVQRLLPHVDVLISDYSGIWVDFLLLDRPIIFVPYDLEKFQRERGMMYDYQSITPGPKVFTGKQFLNELEDYLIDPGKDSALRSKIKTVFHKYDDGLSSERIYDFITKL